MVKCILHSIGLCDEPLLSHIYLYTIYHSCASPDSLPRPSPVAVCHLKWHLQCLECLDAGNSRLLRRPNSDRCGHFEQLFLDYGSMCEKYKNRDIWACVCVREAVNALYSDCSPQSKPIYSEANSHGQGSKQTRCLISFGSRRVSAQGRLILWVSFSLWRSLRKLKRGLGQSLGEWFSGNLIRLWRLYTHTRTVGRFAASAMNRLNV